MAWLRWGPDGVIECVVANGDDGMGCWCRPRGLGGVTLPFRVFCEVTLPFRVFCEVTLPFRVFCEVTLPFRVFCEVRLCRLASPGWAPPRGGLTSPLARVKCGAVVLKPDWYKVF
jgi:hypothetical protein